MTISLTWLGHATWLVTIGGDTEHKLLLDPFLTDSPTAPLTCAEVDADVILISHGHFDHVADAAEIANKNDATLVANFEIASWFANQHSVKNTIGMNIGGQTSLGFADVKMTHAIHSSQLPDGSYGGNPGGFVVSIGERKIYFACDTALFSDLQLIGNLGIDVAVVPIGDLFTMGVDDSVEATKLIAPRQVIPTHYNTWPPIEQNADAWSAKIRSKTNAEPIVLTPGQAHEL